MEHSVDYLLDQVNKVIMQPSAESIRAGVLDACRACIRLIGIKLVCKVEVEEIEIVDSKYRFPEKFMGFIAFYPIAQSMHSKNLSAHHMPHGARTGDHRYDFQKTSLELIFPNIRNGRGELHYYSLYTDDNDDIIIPDDIFQALKTWCEWQLLTDSNNPRLPRWPERQLMRQDAYVAINEARGNMNESHRLSSLR